MKRFVRILCAVAALSLLSFGVARAQLTIEIIGGASQAIPIAIVPFDSEQVLPLALTNVISADLTRSGLFRTVDSNVQPPPVRAEDVQSAMWRSRGADAVVVGSARPSGDGRVEVRFALVDVVKQTTLASMVYTVPTNQLRATAHKIADVIYQKLTGAAGVFSTRIAYVTKQGSRFQLLVADADGNDPQAIVSSSEPLMSPRWSPDGTRLAYVSFEAKKPVVYVQSLTTGARQAVANFRGTNSSPAWSPDGRRLADLRDERRWRRPRARAHLAGDRHRGGVHTGRPVALVHVRSRRHAADLPCQSGERRSRAAHVRGLVQRLAASAPRRIRIRLRAAR